MVGTFESVNIHVSIPPYTQVIDLDNLGPIHNFQCADFTTRAKRQAGAGRIPERKEKVYLQLAGLKGKRRWLSRSAYMGIPFIDFNGRESYSEGRNQEYKTYVQFYRFRRTNPQVHAGGDR